MTPVAWPVIRLLLSRRREVCLAGAAGVAVLAFWLAWRTGWPELYAIGVLLGAATHFVLRAAIEVVSLVAETLLPQ